MFTLSTIFACALPAHADSLSKYKHASADRQEVYLWKQSGTVVFCLTSDCTVRAFKWIFPAANSILLNYLLMNMHIRWYYVSQCYFYKQKRTQIWPKNVCRTDVDKNKLTIHYRSVSLRKLPEAKNISVSSTVMYSPTLCIFSRDYFYSHLVDSCGNSQKHLWKSPALGIPVALNQMWCTWWWWLSLQRYLFLTSINSQDILTVL